MHPGVIKESGCWRAIQFREPLEKTLHPMFPTAARKYYKGGESSLIAIRNWKRGEGERKLWGILTGYGQPFWKGSEHIMAPQEMESLFLEQWRHYTRHSCNAKFEKAGRKELRLSIYLLTYTYHSLYFYAFLSGMKPDFTRRWKPMIPFCRTSQATLKNTLILLFGGNFEFNSIAINYSLSVKDALFFS